MSVQIDALVLPAYEDIDGLPGEATPWHEAYDLDGTVPVEGVPTPVSYADEGVAVVPTGIGKGAAATTTSALLASEDVALDDALVVTVGVAGGPPDLAVGSVVVADAIVDWDHKCRVDGTGGENPLSMNPYTGGAVFELNPELRERAMDLAGDVSLDGDASVVTGTNVSGDELWHGDGMASEVAWLVDQHGVGPYRATEMEDAGTALALDRFGLLDQYLCLRGISNHDRPGPGTTARENLFSSGFESGFERGVGNAVRVARQVVDDALSG